MPDLNDVFAIEREGRRLEREKLRPYLRHTDDCGAVIQTHEPWSLN